MTLYFPTVILFTTLGVIMKLINHLKELGFTQYEAKAYIALLQASHSTGYELGKISGIPASKIYEVLGKLQEKQMVLALEGEPRRYIPLPPDEVLSRLKAHYLHSINILSEDLDEIYHQEEQEQHYIWNIHGYDEIMYKIKNVLNSAKKEIFLSVWAEELELIGKQIEKTVNRGIKTHIVLFGETSFTFGEIYRHGREHEIRQERGGRRISIVVDDKTMLVAQFKDNGPTTGAYTHNRGMVLLTKDYIVHDIYTIKIFRKYGDEALEIFKKV